MNATRVKKNIEQDMILPFFHFVDCSISSQKYKFLLSPVNKNFTRQMCVKVKTGRNSCDSLTRVSQTKLGEKTGFVKENAMQSACVGGWDAFPRHLINDSELCKYNEDLFLGKMVVNLICIEVAEAEKRIWVRKRHTSVLCGWNQLGNNIFFRWRKLKY